MSILCRFSVVVLCLHGITAAAASLPDTLDKIRNSVVGVGVLISPDPARQSVSEYRATGFVVGDGLKVITNYHVLPKEEEREERNAILAVFVGHGKNARGRPATIIAADQEHDLALLAITGQPLPAMQLSTGPVREGQEVAFTGFPIGMVLGMYPVTSKTIISAITPIAIPAGSSGRLSANQIRRLRSPFDVYQLDAIAYPGNSGSPVYEPGTGRVLGVVNSVFVKSSKESVLSDPSGITYAVPATYIKALLDND